jgi:hypothetical protein
MILLLASQPCISFTEACGLTGKVGKDERFITRSLQGLMIRSAQEQQAVAMLEHMPAHAHVQTYQQRQKHNCD